MTTEQVSTRPSRFVLRGGQLLLGLVLMSFGMALLVEAELGVPPWDVLSQGLSRQLDISFGTSNLLISVVVLLLWIPLWQRPGIGTIVNGFAIGPLVDGWLWLIAPIVDIQLRLGTCVVGTAVIGVATGMYIGAGLGPGPRDGLMTGFVAKTGRSIRLIRGLMEISVLVVGWLLGGTVGLGTVLFALSIGPLAHVFIPVFSRYSPAK